MGGEGGREIRGASAIFGIVDQSLIFNQKQQEKNIRTLRAYGRYEESPNFLEMEYFPETGGFAVLGTGQEEDDVEVATSRILGALRGGDTLSFQELAQVTGLSRKTVSKIINNSPSIGGPSYLISGEGSKEEPFKVRLA